MSLSKSFASLSPTLLARKGAARPAMRSPLQPIRQPEESLARQVDDLGWDDMGDDPQGSAAMPRAAETQLAEVVALTAQEIALPAQPPEILRQREALAERIAAPAAPRRSALADGRRAAFTLRLDADRHLKLRLASTVGNRSAQQIVTEALDRLIAEQPDIEELAATIRKRG